MTQQPKPSTTPDGGRPSYARLSYWRRYQAFFPPPLRITEANAPEEEWWPWRGGEIHLDRYENPAAPATAIVIHGAGGYGRMCSFVGVMLAAQGYAVVAPDLPGYGLSTVPAHLFTHHGWIDCIADLIAAERARTSTPSGGRPIVLLGASLGGYVAYLAAARTGAVAGLVATTLADPRLQIVRDQFAKFKVLSRLGIPLMPVAERVAGDLRVPIRWLCKMDRIANIPGLTRLVERDPLGGGNRVPLRFLASLFDIVPDVEPEDFDVCPVLLAQPAADRWTTLAASRPLFDRLRVQKQLVLLDGCGHFPVEQPGLDQLAEAVLPFLDGLCR